LAEIDVSYRGEVEADVAPLMELSRGLREYLKSMDAQLTNFARSHPICSRLMQVPGVGTICAIEDPRRFKAGQDIGAYLGLVPRRRQSGESNRSRGITKSGSALTRAHLVNSATYLLNRGPDCALKAWGESVRSRLGSRRARVALGRKLAVVLFTLWRRELSFERFPASDDILNDHSIP
jgi:transposase